MPDQPVSGEGRVVQAKAKVLGDERFPAVFVELGIQWPENASPWESKDQAVCELGEAAYEAIRKVLP